MDSESLAVRRGMVPYSLDLRQKIMAALDRGVGSQRVVAGLFGVSLSFVERLARRQRTTGSLAPRPMRAVLLEAQHWFAQCVYPLH